MFMNYAIVTFPCKYDDRWKKQGFCSEGVWTTLCLERAAATLCCSPVGKTTVQSLKFASPLCFSVLIPNMYIDLYYYKTYLCL